MYINILSKTLKMLLMLVLQNFYWGRRLHAPIAPVGSTLAAAAADAVARRSFMYWNQHCRT